MKKEGGVSIVPCKVNGLNLSFIFDTGASDVTISLTEASFMLKNGYLKKEDIIGSEKYLDATGNISEGIVINLREIEIEGLKIQNVKASIVKTLKAPLLLGQSALSKLGTIKMDLEKNQLTIISALQLAKTEVKKTDLALVNSDLLKYAFTLLVKSLSEPSFNLSELSKYYALNISDELDNDSLWAVPSNTYKELNATSYFYTFLDNKKSNKSNQKPFKVSDSTSYNTIFLQIINRLKSFSKEKGINWSLFDAASVIIKPFNDNDLIYTFNCDKKQYAFLTTINETSTNGDRNIKINLPFNIDSKSFFEYRSLIYNNFMSEIDNIKRAEDQNNQLSYFYERLIKYFEPDYNNLPITDKELFSTLDFEPIYWCERAANLKSEEDNNAILKKLSIFSKGISLYEENAYPKMKESYLYLGLYAYRGECKYRLEDYAGAYEDYKKTINIYEKDVESRDALKTDITGYYYDFSNICYYLKKYDECKLSIQKGISTYSKELDKYLINVTLYRLYTLKGYLYYFIYKNKEQACKDWSRAGELGDKEAYDYIKQYCNK
jgi:hypothetical protein